MLESIAPDGRFKIESATEKEIIARIRKTRDDYDEEEIRHTFWVDSYTGGGGFRNGQVPAPPAPFWGRSQYEYGSSWLSAYTAPGLVVGPARQTWSYLVPFRNEDQMSYNDRVNSSVYHNPIEPIVNITHSFLMSEDAVRQNMPQQIDDWSKNVDGSGHEIHALAREALLRCQLVGRVFTLVDLPSETGRSMFESKKMNISPRIINLWPQDVLDYDVDGEGRITAIKYITYHEKPRESMLDEKIIVERITIWTKDHWEKWDISKDPRTGQEKIDKLEDNQKRGINYFGVVPVVMCVWKNAVGDSRNTTGIPQVATISQMARAMHNRQSEFDFNLRQSTFAQLVVPGDPGETNGNVIEAGPANALTEDAETLGLTRYISPEGTIASTYATEVERMVDAIYRTALIDRGDSTHPETQESKLLRFMQTNAILAEAANHLDTWEADIYALVAIAYHINPSELASMTIRRKRQYAVAEMEKTLNSAIKARSLPIGPYGLATMTKRVFRAMVPDLSPLELEIVDQEIDIVADIQGIEAAPVQARASGNAKLVGMSATGGGENAEDGQIGTELQKDLTKPIRVRVHGLMKQLSGRDVPNQTTTGLRTTPEALVYTEGPAGRVQTG